VLNKNPKKAFTLFEIVISIILVSIVYMFAINSFKKQDIVSDSITLNNLKQKLLQSDFEESILIKCIEDDFTCFIYLDEQIQEKRTNPIFESKPTVYSYDRDYERVEFKRLELENLDSYDIVFEYECKKNKKCSELIVETDKDVYIYNALDRNPTKIDYINDVRDYFDEKINEVRDAF
jgi:hypothetical protein